MPAKGQFKEFCVHGHKRTRETVDKKSGSCKICRSIYTKRWAANNREKYLQHKRQKAKEYRRKFGNTYFRKLRVKSVYGLSEEQFDNMLVVQNNKCAICYKEFGTDYKYKETYPHVDHDHLTDKVRGLVCASCNCMLGYAYDNVSTLQNAIMYLQREES